MKSKINFKIFLFLLLISSSGFARLVVHPTSITDTVNIGANKTATLHITNIGPANPLGYTIRENVSWLSAAPTSGQIAIGETAKVEITLDAATLSGGEYTATITVVDPHHGGIPISVTLIVQSVTVVEDDVEGRIPSVYFLEQNIPNPFNPSTSIRYSIPTNGFVSLKVYTLLGEEAATLVNGFQTAGIHEIQWRADALPSGTYYYRLNTAEYSVTRRMSFIK